MIEVDRNCICGHAAMTLILRNIHSQSNLVDKNHKMVENLTAHIPSNETCNENWNINIKSSMNQLLYEICYKSITQGKSYRFYFVAYLLCIWIFKHAEMQIFLKL